MSANARATAAVMDLVTRLRYKPGATFVVIPDATSIHDPAVYIDMGFDVPDSLTALPSRAACGLNVPEAIALAPAAVMDLIRTRLIEFETHELDEFLIFDGNRVNDPHCVGDSQGTHQ